MDLLVYDDDERRYVPWAVALMAALAAAVLAAGLAFAVARATASADEDSALSDVSRPAPATAPSEPASAPPPTPATTAVAPDEAACTAALERADAVLARGESLAEFLAEHTRIQDELLAGRFTQEQALDQTLPVLTDGATERKRFAEELTAYQESREQCTS